MDRPGHREAVQNAKWVAPQLGHDNPGLTLAVVTSNRNQRGELERETGFVRSAEFPFVFSPLTVLGARRGGYRAFEPERPKDHERRSG